MDYARESGAADYILVNDDLERAYTVFKQVALGEQSIKADTLPIE